MLKQTKKWLVLMSSGLALQVFCLAQAKAISAEHSRFVLEKDTVVHSLNYQAEVSPRNSVKIVPEVSGLVSKRYFEAGDLIEEGQVLYELENESYILALEESKSELERRQSIRQKLQADLARAEKLFQTKSISDAELKSLQMDVRAAEAAVHSAMALYKAAQYKLNKSRIVSPIGGYVEIPHIDVGAYVKAEVDVLTVVTDQSVWYLDFEIPYSEYVKFGLSDFNPGAQNSAESNQKYRLSMPVVNTAVDELKLIYRARQLTPTSGGVHFRALLASDVKLVSGARESITIDILRSDEFHKVPRQALIIEEGNYFLMGIQADGSLEKSKVDYMMSFDNTFVLVRGQLPYKAISTEVVGGI